MEIFRGAIFHTPRNPFREAGTLTSFSDGGLAVADGCVAACGDYAEVRRAHPEAEVHDLRGGFVLPGFADTHVHFPQVRVMGSLGEPLLDWLAHRALPEEAKMADAAYAREVAGEFLRGLASHGTTSALVFGAHFEAAMEMFFTRAGLSGLRIASGLVVSDRGLRPELHITADEAYARSTALIRRFHGVGRVRYAVTPRFAVSASEAMLEACQTLLAENPGVMATTHINENPAEIAEVARLFPWSRDYLAVICYATCESSVARCC